MRAFLRLLFQILYIIKTQWLFLYYTLSTLRIHIFIKYFFFKRKTTDSYRKTEKMKRQRAMYQMKEQEKTPERQLNEVEIGNLPEK